MTSVSKNIYFNVLDSIVDKYNNTYHNSIKMKPIDVKSKSHAEYNVDCNDKDPKFKIGDHVRISRHKKVSAKEYAPHWSEEVFVIKKVKNTFLWTYVIMDLNSEDTVGTFYEKEFQNTNQEKLRTEKVIKRKGNKLYVKWKSLW